MVPNPIPNVPADPALSAGSLIVLLAFVIVVAAAVMGYVIASRSRGPVIVRREITLDREIVLPDVERRRQRHARAG